MKPLKKIIAIGAFLVVMLGASPGYCWGGGYRPTCGSGGEYTLHDGCVPVRPVAPVYVAPRGYYAPAMVPVAISTPGYIMRGRPAYYGNPGYSNGYGHGGTSVNFGIGVRNYDGYGGNSVGFNFGFSQVR